MNTVYNDLSNCCGCALCEYVCPKNAITMKMIDGFYYPDINQELCIDCGICQKKCPFNKDKNEQSNCKEAYALKNKNDDVIKKSSSGGIFTALSDYILSLDGYIIGADFDQNMNAIHTVASTSSERDRMRGSKYIQCDTAGIYYKIKQLLETGKPILFTGTPCQVAAARTAFSGKENIYFVDIICHGVPSPDVWKKYVDFIENKYNKKLAFYSFRDKEKSGWRNYSAKLTFTDGSTLSHNNITGSFIELFSYDVCMRESCTKCPFTSLFRYGDITIGDFWGIENIIPEISDNKGISAVMLNTQNGENLFSKISSSVDVFACKQTDIAKKQPNLSRPSSFSNKAANFQKDIRIMPFEEILKKYTRVGMKRRIIDLVKTILKK